MRIVFMGTADFGVPALERLVAEGFAPELVVTVPDKPAGRGQKMSSSPIKEAAVRLNIPLEQPDSLKDPAFVERLRTVRPDLIIVIAFRILPQEVYTIPSKGAFNLHASLLPKYRGAAPIQWAVINGEHETGVTTFFLDRTVDTGNIILQRRLAIGENETVGELYGRLSLLGIDAVLETVRMIAAGNVAVQSQDGSLATPAPKIFKENCRIDWSKPARDVHNFIRGVSPRPGAYTSTGGVQYKMYRTLVANESSTGSVGAIRVDGGKLLVQCSTGTIEVVEIQQEGRKTLSAVEFLRGTKIEDGKFE